MEKRENLRTAWHTIVRFSFISDCFVLKCCLEFIYFSCTCSFVACKSFDFIFCSILKKNKKKNKKKYLLMGECRESAIILKGHYLTLENVIFIVYVVMTIPLFMCVTFRFE